MKKAIVFILVLTLSLPFANAFAAGQKGKWTKVGTDTFTSRSKIVKSGGGDFKICLVSGAEGTYSLWEEDGAIRDGAAFQDEYVGDMLLKKGKCAVFHNINRFKDRDNFKNQAEFYITKKKAGKGKATVTFWD